MNQHFYAVIMAGGIGSRFWPMSTSEHPKQFMDILGTGKTLLQQTFDRLARVCPANNIYIVTNERYRAITMAQLPGINSGQVLCEPDRRNTAPCIAYANLRILKSDPKASIIVAPSDHLILKEDIFSDLVEKSLNYVSEKDVLLTIGIKPSRPDTGYGYINYETGKDGFVKVKSFREKPDLETAKNFLASGDYSWNSGMFIWNIKSIQSAYKTLLPNMYAQFMPGENKMGTDDETSFINSIYSQCDNISIDYGIMEKAPNVEVINGDFGWSDLGTWGSLYTHIDHDSHGNALVGKNIMTFNSSGNITHISGEKQVVLQGLHDFIVIDHDNTLLICKKEEEQEIKKIVEAVEKKSKS